MESPIFPGSQSRMWAVFSHLGILLLWIPMATVLLSLIIWLSQKDKDAFIERHSRAALNFQLTMLFGFLAGYLLGTVGGMYVLGIVGMIDLVFSVMGAMAANSGDEYKYPFSLALVK
jgi:uncharacterized protein